VALLDPAIIATGLLLIFTSGIVFFFHAMFALLTLGAFYWRFRAFVVRASFWLTVTSVVVVLSVRAGKVHPGELIEIPLMTIILILVYSIARQRGHAVRALSGERDTLDAIMENTRTQLAYLDPQFNFVRVNSAYVQGCGHSEEDLLGRNHFDLFPDPENQAIFERVRDTLQPVEFRAKPFEFPGQPERGITYWDWTLAPVIDSDRRLQGLVLSLLDVTEKHRAEAAIRQTLAESHQRQTEVAVLLDAARAVLGFREFGGAAYAIFAACKNLLGAAAGYIVLLAEGEGDNELVYLNPGGMPRLLDQEPPPPLKDLLETAYQAGKVSYINDFHASQWGERLTQGHPAIDNILLAPMLIKGIAVGLLGLINKPAGFTENDARLASAFAELAAIALFNSRALESLESSEERFRSVAQSASEAIMTINSEGNIVFWNQAASDIFGYTQDEIIGQPLTCLMPERSRTAHQNGLQQVVSGGKPHSLKKMIEVVGFKKGGREFPMELSASSWKVREGIFFTGIVRDITELKRAQEALRRANEELEDRVLRRTAQLTNVNAELVREIAQRKEMEETLRESEERYRRLVELSFEGISIHRNGILLYANPYATKLAGATSPDEVIGKPLRDFVRPDDWSEVEARLPQVEAGIESAPPVEQKLVRLDGTTVDVEVLSVPITYQGQPAVQSVIRDLSARKQAEIEREKERARIARDLHDSLGHSIAYLHLKLDQLAGQRTVAKNQDVRRDLARLRDVANEAYALVRGMLASTLPTYSTDFATALLVEARAIGRRGNFRVDLTSQGSSRPISPVVQQQLLYLLKEALVNVEKHAGACHVNIKLAWSEDNLTITLADDGKGFDLNAAQTDQHFGLVIMRDRARETNVQLKLNSSPDAGTELVLQLPLLPTSRSPARSGKQGGKQR
jgi:PAS domain S-box-containing protein